MSIKRSKIIFTVLAILFLILIAVASYDISRQATAPWEKSHMKKSLDEISE